MRCSGPPSSRWIALAGLLLVAGCDDGGGLDTVELPACAQIEQFGNGQSCTDEAGQVDLARCGDPARAGCTPGRLCVEDATYLACRCATDADCGGWALYVNAARKVAGLPLVEPTCVQAHCQADLPVAAPVDGDAAADAASADASGP